MRRRASRLKGAGLQRRGSAPRGLEPPPQTCSEVCADCARYPRTAWQICRPSNRRRRRRPARSLNSFGGAGGALDVRQGRPRSYPRRRKHSAPTWGQLRLADDGRSATRRAEYEAPCRRFASRRSAGGRDLSGIPRVRRASMQTVACMRWGTLFPPDYVNRLYRGAMRNVMRARRAFSLSPTIPAAWRRASNSRPIPPIRLPATGLGGSPWRKLALWSRDIGVAGDMLFLDLDVVVVGALDAFFDFLKPGKLAIIRDWGVQRKRQFVGHALSRRRRAASGRRLRGGCRWRSVVSTPTSRSILRGNRDCRRRFGLPPGARDSKPWMLPAFPGQSCQRV